MRIGAAQLAVAVGALVLAGAAGSSAQDELFKSRRINPGKSEYPKGIEGPAVDAAGNLYVVNFEKQGRIGLLKPGAVKSERFADLPDGSIGNGIRFDRDGRMYVADYKKHNVFVFEKGQTAPSVYFTSSQFTQPNDLAIAADGTLYASDPKFAAPSGGKIWRIVRGQDGKGRGEVMASERTMGVTNGLDLSPDGTTLYVSESPTAEIWAYRIDGNKLTAPRRVAKFAKRELDGLRTDVDGRIYVARPGNRAVTIVAPDGTTVKEIATIGNDPTNLAFGGPDGRTVFVTQQHGGFIERFRTDRPGREPCLQQQTPGLCAQP